MANHLFSRDAPPRQGMLVDKQGKTAYLIDISNGVPVIKESFDRLLFGENGGDKEHEGDKRTPEGVYSVTGSIPDKRLDARFGTGAFPLDYPNPLDQVEGHDGSGIWLHGRDDEDKDKRVTKGCVAFNNRQITALQGKLPVGTPVIITRQAEFVSQAEYWNTRKQLLDVLDGFIGSWRKGDLKALAGYLHPRFHSGWMDARAWLARKARLQDAFPYRHIETGNIYVFKEDGNQVVFDFEQTYCAGNMVARGNKRLYFKRSGDTLGLVTETYSELPLGDLIETRVREFLDQWLTAWRDKDLKRYLTYYSPAFTGPQGRDLNGWAEYKGRVFGGRASQQIDIEDIEIQQIHGDKYSVRFKQSYRSDTYSDYGSKILTLGGCPGDFHILSEDWKAL